MAKSRRIPKKLEAGDRVKLQLPYGDLQIGAVGELIQFQKSSHGRQAWVDFGAIRQVVFVDEITLADD